MKKIAVLLLSSILLAGCAQQEVIDHSNKAENPTSQIINGTPSVQGARPYQVALLMNGRQGCGGTIISEEWVLTAGHCVGNGRGLSIRAGSLKSASGGQLISVAKATRHPNYGTPTRGYDIAVLKLSKPLQFNKNVQPAVLPTKAIESQYAKVGTNLIISGWGMTKGRDRRSVSNVLREAPMSVISNSACGQQLGGSIGRGMICGDKNRSGQTGCHGDSGGPYVGQGNGKIYVFGLVSWGTPSVCDKATVFASVSEYQPWVTKATGVQPDQGSGNPDNPSPECEGLKTFDGNFAQENYSKFHSNSKGFQCSGKMKAVLSSRAAGDFDLYLQKQNSAGYWIDVASSNEESHDETITYNAPDGIYRWEVYAYEGKGSYKLVGNKK